MTGKPAATDCSHPSYPEYRKQFGEDPARFIYHTNPEPRIRGIDDPDLLRAYLHVEVERDEPRKGVVALCNQRLSRLDTSAHAAEPAVATDGGEEQ